MEKYVILQQINEYEFGLFIKGKEQVITAVVANHLEFLVRVIGEYITLEAAFNDVFSLIENGFNLDGFNFRGRQVSHTDS